MLVRITDLLVFHDRFFKVFVIADLEVCVVNGLQSTKFALLIKPEKLALVFGPHKITSFIK